MCEIILPIKYDDINIDAGYRIDMIVGDSVIIENKTVEKLLPIHVMTCQISWRPSALAVKSHYTFLLP
jgi:GxxExxY protein